MNRINPRNSDRRFLGNALNVQTRLPLEDTRELPCQLLPCDGDARYFGVLFERPQANRYLSTLFHAMHWQRDEVVIYAKRQLTQRKVAWYGDREFAYTYSGQTRVARPWVAPLPDIKNLVEQATGYRYNACLLNLYEDGSQGMGWHSDNEKSLAQNSSIASVSFGAHRRFDLRHNPTGIKRSIVLEHGSLLLIAGTTQNLWQHQLPRTRKVSRPRINLTFRTMLD